MKKFLLCILASSLALCLQAQEKTSFIFGLSWGYAAGLYEQHTSVYRNMTPPHFAIADNGNGWTFLSLGDVSTNAGISFGKHSELCLEAGYAGISKDSRTFTTLLRYGFLFNGRLNDGWLIEMTAGPGWKLSGYGKNPAYLAGLGTGYRIHLGGKACLDFKFGIRQSFDRPVLKDKLTGAEISGDYIVRNWNFLSSLRAGLCLSL